MSEAAAIRNIEVLSLGGDGGPSRALYTLVSLHARSGAEVLLDLEGTEDPSAGGLERLVGPYREVAEGNSQRLGLLLGAEASGAVAGLPSFRDLLDALGPAGKEGKPLDLECGLPCEVKWIAPLRAYAGREIVARYPGEAGFRIEVVLEELCLNAIENSPSPESRFRIRLSLEGTVLTVRVSNPLGERRRAGRIIQRRIESFDDSGAYLGEKGRGLFLVASIADGLKVQSSGGGEIQVVAWKDLGEANREQGGSPG